eukprot:TRINITY_DN62051_c0_g1_i1.p1 TRINITY_DN62051_c0_g1~~TRINITY_DN62051_c0_g1_i1.p1  ORF type:complete len:447 (+),score=74.18 TRINITY_DN62051_c0_g1_i1:37-1377(+)
MARRKTREYHAKRILRQALEQTKAKQIVKLDDRSVQVTPETNWDTIAQSNPWLESTPLVVKPDMLFGQRGKHNLVLLNADLQKAQEFVQDRINTPLTVKGLTDTLTHFLIEPFIPHKDEYYMSMQVKRYCTRINFSSAGGMDVEENWDKSMRTVDIPVGDSCSMDTEYPKDFWDGVPEERIPILKLFLQLCHQALEAVDFTMLEMNPFCFDNDAMIQVLDMRGELDDAAAYKNGQVWGNVEFPTPFGRLVASEDKYIEELDSRTGASLKLSILNRKGRVWTMVAGGGASVIYSDTVFDYGMGNLLGNYGEYSGAPIEEHTFQYAKTLLSVATTYDEKTAPYKGRVLLIGGAIANFTDIAVTFKGIMRALMDSAAQLANCDFKIFVRRGGPNYERALDLMRQIAPALGVEVEVFGPQVSMTTIVGLAHEYLKKYDEEHDTPDEVKVK